MGRLTGARGPDLKIDIWAHMVEMEAEGKGPPVPPHMIEDFRLDTVEGRVKIDPDDDETHTLMWEVKPKLEELGFTVIVQDVHFDFDPERDRAKLRWNTRRVTADEIIRELRRKPGQTAEY